MINRTTISFLSIGFLNNVAFVVMLAVAKDISEGGTALVFIANTLPGFLVKLSSPYWFDRVSYCTRMRAGGILMGSSFSIVGLFSLFGKESSNDGKVGFPVLMQLFGVALGSMQASLGEASLLALCGKADGILNGQETSVATDEEVYQGLQGTNNTEQHCKEDKSMCIAAFSSGTGLAGFGGFTFVFICTKIFALSLQGTLAVSMIFPVLYWKVYSQFLAIYATADTTRRDGVENDDRANFVSSEMAALSAAETHEGQGDSEEVCEQETDLSSDEFLDNPQENLFSIRLENQKSDIDTESTLSSSPTETISEMSFFERFCLVLSLWPYMIPLFVVYYAEYALQSGVWTSIGFPVDNEDERASFYVASNWMYQAGVFISRSSGAFFIAPMWLLWLMPFLQVVNLVVFYYIAIDHFLYNGSLFMGCFYVGLLGGSVYVHGYSRINTDLPFEKREFALSSASLADSLGIVFANVSGLFIQSCLYLSNNINGAVVKCPL